MFKSLPRLEVLYLMTHLVITLCIIVLYGVLTALGHNDETLRNLLLLIGGYWFGAMSGQTIKSNLDKKQEAAAAKEE
jgi:hypothetical protein